MRDESGTPYPVSDEAVELDQDGSTYMPFPPFFFCLWWGYEEFFMPFLSLPLLRRDREESRVYPG